MTIQHELVDLIRRNRISTTEVADALDKSGSLPGVMPLSGLQKATGPIRVITPAFDSNFAVHRDIIGIEPGDVVLIEPIQFSDVAVFGELIAKYCILYKQAAGIVVNGNVRDTARLIRDGYPIWCTGSNPVGAQNTYKGEDSNLSSPIVDKYDGGVAVCDEGGVVLIPAEDVNQAMLTKLQKIEAIEDLWHYCLNTLKWNTYEIVVLQRYRYDTDEIPSTLLEFIDK